jgi:hypothetical protein
MFVAMPAKTGLHGSHDAQDVKQRRVCRNLQVEIHQTVNQDSAYTEHGS